MKKNQAGRSMVEMLGVLAIVGVLSIGGIAGYSMAMEKHRINQTIEAISLIIAEARTMFARQGSYDGIGDYASDGSLGGEDTIAASIIKNLEVNSPYSIGINEYESNNGIDAMGFLVLIKDMPESVCVALNTKSWSEYGSDYGGIYDSSTDENVKKMTLSMAQDSCESHPYFDILINPVREPTLCDLKPTDCGCPGQGPCG